MATKELRPFCVSVFLTSLSFQLSCGHGKSRCRGLETNSHFLWAPNNLRTLRTLSIICPPFSTSASVIDQEKRTPSFVLLCLVHVLSRLTFGRRNTYKAHNVNLHLYTSDMLTIPGFSYSLKENRIQVKPELISD